MVPLCRKETVEQTQIQIGELWAEPHEKDLVDCPECVALIDKYLLGQKEIRMRKEVNTKNDRRSKYLLNDLSNVA